MGFFEGQEKILAAPTDHYPAPVCRIDRFIKWIGDSSIHLYHILILYD
jgi:hypothetical protein